MLMVLNFDIGRVGDINVYFCFRYCSIIEELFIGCGICFFVYSCLYIWVGRE